MCSHLTVNDGGRGQDASEREHVTGFEDDRASRFSNSIFPPAPSWLPVQVSRTDGKSRPPDSDLACRTRKVVSGGVSQTKGPRCCSKGWHSPGCCGRGGKGHQPPYSSCVHHFIHLESITSHTTSDFLRIHRPSSMVLGYGRALVVPPTST